MSNPASSPRRPRIRRPPAQALNAPAIHLPLGQSSDAPHLPNERIRLLNLITGVAVLEAFFADVAGGSLDAAASAGASAGTSAVPSSSASCVSVIADEGDEHVFH